MLKIIPNKKNIGAEIMAMQPRLIPEPSPTLISWLQDFLAKHSAWRASGKDLTIQEERSFLISQGFSITNDPDIFCLKTLKVYYLITEEKLSKQYLKFSPTWGMTLNGRYLTAKISESPRIGKECTLSDILEEEVEEKYFLSNEMGQKLMNDV